MFIAYLYLVSLQGYVEKKRKKSENIEIDTTPSKFSQKIVLCIFHYSIFMQSFIKIRIFEFEYFPCQYPLCLHMDYKYVYREGIYVVDV